MRDTMLGLSVNVLAKHLNGPTSRMNDIVLERRGVSTDTALRITRCLGGRPDLAQPRQWLEQLAELLIQRV